MTNKSLVYVLWFVVAWLGYTVYKCEEENRRLFNIANDLKEQMEDQTRLIRTQQLYIEYLNNSAPTTPQPSPLHGPL